MPRYTVTYNGLCKITSLSINGKEKGLATLRRAEGTSYWKQHTHSTLFQNPFSRVVVELTPFESTLYHFCKEWYRRYSCGGETEVPVSVYDYVKGLFLAINPDAYTALID